jgi:hypothetical protein
LRWHRPAALLRFSEGSLGEIRPGPAPRQQQRTESDLKGCANVTVSRRAGRRQCFVADAIVRPASRGGIN